MRGVLRVGLRLAPRVRHRPTSFAFSSSSSSATSSSSSSPSASASPFLASSSPSSSSPSASSAPDIADKYAESLLRFAERVGRPAVRLSGIRYDGTVKRFYQKVDVEETPEGFAPTLGGRFMQTAGGFLMEVPSRKLATALAMEWDYQLKVIKPHTMPLMHLVTQAVDQVPIKRHAMLRTVMSYVDFDSACVRDYDDDMLSRAQQKHLDPVVEWFEERFGVQVNVTREDQMVIEPIRQSAETRSVIETRLAGMTDWEYSVFEQCCGVSKSIMISIAILEGQLDLQRSFESARLEENYSMRKNGMIGGAFGHGIDIEFVKTRLAAARTMINMINYDTPPHAKPLSQRNSFHNPPPKPQVKQTSGKSGSEELMPLI